MADLNKVLAPVLKPERQRFAFDPHVENGEHVYRVYGVPDIDPAWSLIIGDCINNLRSALDHLAWQLVVLDGGRPNHKTQFPIHEAPFDGKGNITPVNLRPSVKRGDILDALEMSQPYRGFNGEFVDSHDSLLWVLRELNNIDKHRLLLVVACVFNYSRMWWGVDESDPRFDLRINLAPLKDRDPVAWFNFHGAEPPSDFNPHPSLQITLYEKTTGPFGFESAVDLLEALIDEFLIVIDYRFGGFFP